MKGGLYSSLDEGWGSGQESFVRCRFIFCSLFTRTWELLQRPIGIVVNVAVADRLTIGSSGDDLTIGGHANRSMRGWFAAMRDGVQS